MAIEAQVHQTDVALSGLDALEATPTPVPHRGRRIWARVWPRLVAVGLALLVWQLVVWSGWRPTYVLPAPATVWESLRAMLGDGAFWRGVGVTMQRAIVGFAIALVVGTVIGVSVARSRVLRTAVGSLITGLQTMPSIAWFPLAILLFRLSEAAILFVVVLGAAPSIAAGLIGGIDHVPPILVRAGRVMGANRVALLRSVILPAAMPSFVGGLRQGWAFAWRSLMAGELLVLIPGRNSIGATLEFNRQFNDAAGLLAVMVVILVIGLLVDAVFSRADHMLRARRGLLAS